MIHEQLLDLKNKDEYYMLYFAFKDHERQAKWLIKCKMIFHRPFRRTWCKLHSTC